MSDDNTDTMEESGTVLVFVTTEIESTSSPRRTLLTVNSPTRLSATTVASAALGAASSLSWRSSHPIPPAKPLGQAVPLESGGSGTTFSHTTELDGDE